MRLLVVVLVACSSKSEPPPTLAPVPTVAVPDAAMPAFVRIPPVEATRAYFQRPGPGQQVGNMQINGEFACKLTALFGPPDEWVPLYHYDPPMLGFPLKHVATGTVIVPHLKSYGYAALDSPHVDAVANELDALLAVTKPVDCAVTFWSYYRVNEAGVRDGKPYFEHLGFARTLDMRMAQFAQNDAHGGDRKERVEREVCIMTRQNWAERTLKTPEFEGEYADYPHKDAVRARLKRCLEDAVAQLENDIDDGVDDMEHEGLELWKAYVDLELEDGALAARIKRARERLKRAR